MSSCPGYRLEDFVMWYYNITVEDESDANVSLHYAEILEIITTRRPRLTEDQFEQVLSLFEEYRGQVERTLEDFDEETMSWRMYGGYCFDFIPDEIYASGQKLINKLKPRGVYEKVDFMFM